MDSLFGISMNLIMWVLLAILGVALASVAFVALRNPVMFKIGLRNIPRRRSQTILIVLGLMLSTLIISAAFTTGDTVHRTITSEIYSILGSLDETVRPRTSADVNFDQEDPDTVNREDTFTAEDGALIVRALETRPLIDAVVPVYADVAVAVNSDKRLSSPVFNLTGIDPERSRGLPDIQTRGGEKLRVADLGPGEIYVTESAADDLNVRAGDTVQLFAFGQTTSFRVKAVVRDRRLAGAGGISVRRQGGVVPLAVAQQLFNAPGRLTMIAVSNQGDSRQGYKNAAAVTPDLRAALASAGTSAPFGLAETKKQGVAIAETGASVFTTFFLVLGLFSIGSGVLLIFMIFVMLAAERKSEMGMTRAVGTKRLDLVQTFLSEGMAYNLLAAMVGTGLGVGVAFGIARIAASLFSQFNITVSPYVTPRSLLISYSLGVVLTFLTVTFSSWRISNINIVRAIRDIPDPPAPRPLWRVQGFLATLRRLVFKPGRGRAWVIRPALLVGGIAIAMSSAAAGLVVLQVVLAIGGGLVFLTGIFLTFQFGPLFVAGGIPLIVLGSSGAHQFPLYAGLSLLPLGMALLIRSFGASERATYTTAGLLLLYIWEFDYNLHLVDKIFGKTDGRIEMFFLSGVMITIAATFVVVYNSDLILSLVTLAGRRLGALVPSIKMAVAYPLANRMRTGLTMAMFCLVVFALVVMSTMNYNFSNVFLSDRSLGGWDVVVDESPTNPVPDLRQALAAAESPAAASIQSVGVTSIVTGRRARACQVTDVNPTRCSSADPKKFTGYEVRGEDPAFLANSKIHLQARAHGYDSGEAVWAAVGRDPTLAVGDPGILDSGGFGGDGFVKGIDRQARDFDPVTVTLLDRLSGRMANVTIIGIIELGSSSSYGGIHVADQTVEAIYGKPDFRRFFVKTPPGADKREVARQIEAALLTTGAQAESLRHAVDSRSSTITGFFRLMQGFMGLGLFVGVAAVGVIAFRTVVERRQQIGMLRALGYTRRMIGMTFLIESAFIAFMGVASGIVFALILAHQRVTEQFANQGVTSFVVPWVQVGIIGGLAFGFALIMTLVPSRQAARIPIAQALRYE